MSITEWEEQRYRQAFESTCHYLEVRRTEYGLTISELEAMLEAAYRRQGNDWLGRGVTQDISEDAIVAAYEHMLAEWKSAEGNK